MRILVLSPHPDDGELACAGMVMKYNKKHEFFWCCFSDCGVRGIHNEFNASMDMMRIKDYNFFSYQVRTFDSYRQDILDDIIKTQDEFKPDVVIIPSCNDKHQDHYTVSAEAIRAFYHTPQILMYEQEHNTRPIESDIDIKLSDEDIDAKLAVLACYQSQSGKPYFNPEYIRGRLRWRDGHYERFKHYQTILR